MASQSRETRQKQLAEWEVKLQKRLALLGEKGFDEKKIARDVLVKELKAKIKESQVRLRAIGANEKQTAELAAIKAERLAKPKRRRPKRRRLQSRLLRPNPRRKRRRRKAPSPSRLNPRCRLSFSSRLLRLSQERGDIRSPGRPDERYHSAR